MLKRALSMISYGAWEPKHATRKAQKQHALEGSPTIKTTDNSEVLAHPDKPANARMGTGCKGIGRRRRRRRTSWQCTTSLCQTTTTHDKLQQKFGRPLVTFVEQNGTRMTFGVVSALSRQGAREQARSPQSTSDRSPSAKPCPFAKLPQGLF